MKYRIRFWKTTTTTSWARLWKEIFCAGKRGTWRVGMSTSFPLKYPLSSRNSRRNRYREWAADAAKCCRSLWQQRQCQLCTNTSSSWNVKLWWTAILPIRSDLPHSDRIYISRHSILPSSSASTFSPSRHSCFAHETSFDTKAATPWDFTSQRCDTALSNPWIPLSPPPPQSFNPTPSYNHVALLLHRIAIVASDFQNYIARIFLRKIHVDLIPTMRFERSK